MKCIILYAASNDYKTTLPPIPPNHLHQPYWLEPRYSELIIAQYLPYINSGLRHPAFFLDP
jgi:hypothetical protein